MSDFDRSFFTLANDTPFRALECRKAFEGLTEKERLYAYYLSQASWYGSLIVLHQTSPESPLIFLLLRKLLKHQSLDELKEVALGKAGLNEEEFKAFLIYISGFFMNSGNYKGFGDTKFVPNVDKAKIEALIRISRAYEVEKEALDCLLSIVSEKMYSLEERERQLGFADKGVTTYHSANVEKADAERVDRYMKAKKFEAWNTRLFKSIDAETGKALYEIRLASIDGGTVTEPEEFEDFLITVTRGDYGPLLERVNHFLALAKEHAANENQIGMLQKYIEHFKTGLLDLHKDGSRYWIKDVGPAVESYIGFIENYRDPAGSRSEFEGFVAAVNRSTSEKFARLVDNASQFLALLPWDREYEKDKFMRPDFTSLDVICFGGSGVPAGISIPNYDEVRQNEGFKNVSLGNVIAAKPLVKLGFVKAEDEALIKKYDIEAFEVQVGLRELLGHGSGKLFFHNKDGTYNFDTESVRDLETGQKITSWYEEGELYSAKFGALSSAYEECRAEAVGYYLCTFPEVMRIFGYDDANVADDVKYVNLLSEYRSGLISLEYYSPQKQAWGQAHCHARFVLLMVAVEAGEGFIQIKEFENPEDGKPDLLLTMDRTKIESVGTPAIGKFLKKLQLFKCTGDFVKAKALFDRYSQITPEVIRWREIVVARRKPRRILVIPNTVLKDGQVDLVTYPETPEGCVQSIVERYADDKIEPNILDLWKKDEESWFSSGGRCGFCRFFAVEEDAALGLGRVLQDEMLRRGINTITGDVLPLARHVVQQRLCEHPDTDWCGLCLAKRMMPYDYLFAVLIRGAIRSMKGQQVRQDNEVRPCACVMLECVDEGSAEDKSYSAKSLSDDSDLVSFDVADGRSQEEGGSK